MKYMVDKILLENYVMNIANLSYQLAVITL